MVNPTKDEDSTSTATSLDNSADTSTNNNNASDDNNNNNKPMSNQEEGVLRDVLSELEKERIRRAELEAEIFQLKQRRTNEKAAAAAAENSSKNTSGSSSIDRHSPKLAIVPQVLRDEDCMTQIHAMVSRFKSKSTGFTQSLNNHRHLSCELSTLFGEFYENSVKARALINGGDVGDCSSSNVQVQRRAFSLKKKEKIEKETRVKEAVNQVVRYYKEHASQRLSFEENMDQVLVPIVKVTLSDFCRTLQESSNSCDNRKQKRSNSNTSSPSQSPTLTSSLLPNNETLERKMHLDILTLRTERDGLLDLVDALTTDNNAIRLSADGAPGTLPLHVVRCLEIMPWEAEEYSLVVEEVHEWQVYDRWSKSWTSRLKAFPPHMANLPINKLDTVVDDISPSSSFENNDPTKDSNNDQTPTKKLQRVFDNMSLGGESLLTDKSCTHILNLKNGYPLPTYGTWEWVSGWSLTTSTDLHDADGWTYADRPEYIVSQLSSQCFNSSKAKVDDAILHTVRRRTRRRRRALISYPGISQRTKEMLGYRARDARMTLAVEKLNDQVLSMQKKLEEKEVEMDGQAAGLLAQLELVEQEVLDREERIGQLEHRFNEGDVKSPKGGGEKSLIVVMKRGLGGVSKSFAPDKVVGRGRPALAILGDSIEKENFENLNESKVAEGDEKIIHTITPNDEYKEADRDEKEAVLGEEEQSTRQTEDPIIHTAAIKPISKMNPNLIWKSVKW